MSSLCAENLNHGIGFLGNVGVLGLEGFVFQDLAYRYTIEHAVLVTVHKIGDLVVGVIGPLLIGTVQVHYLTGFLVVEGSDEFVIGKTYKGKAEESIGLAITGL